MNIIKLYADVPANLEVNRHAFDYFDFSYEELQNAAFKAKDGFVTIGGGKLPTLFVALRGEVYGLVVATKQDENGFFSEVLTVLPAHEAYRNAEGRNSLPSEAAVVELV